MLLSVCLILFAVFVGGTDPDGSILPEMIAALICAGVSQVLAYLIYGLGDGLGELVERVESIDRRVK